MIKAKISIPVLIAGTVSNVGLANPALSVRRAGNIRGLLVIRGVCGSSVPSGCAHVKCHCLASYAVVPMAKSWMGIGAVVACVAWALMVQWPRLSIGDSVS